MEHQSEQQGVKSAMLLMMESFGSYGDVPSKAEERELIRRAQAGDHEALGEIVTRNMRLVVMFARRLRRLGVDLEDLVQEGFFALHNAVEKFDAKASNRFAAYAGMAIRNRMIRYAEHHTYFVPVQLPSNRSVWSESTRNAAEKFQSGVVRLDCRPADDSDAIDIRDGTDPPRTFEEIEEQEKARRTLRRMLHQLPARIRSIIWRRAEGETLLDIAKSMGICRERVRQLEVRGLDLLRQSYGLVPKRKKRRRGRPPKEVAEEREGMKR